MGIGRVDIGAEGGRSRRAFGALCDKIAEFQEASCSGSVAREWGKRAMNDVQLSETSLLKILKFYSLLTGTAYINEAQF